MNFFEVKVKYLQMQEETVKKVTETYAIDAESFTEAECRTIEEMSAVTSDITVMSEKRAQYHEFVYDEGDLHFLVKFNLIAADETTGKESRTAMYVLFKSVDIDSAKEAARRYMAGSVMDYEIEYIKETKIVEVLLHNGD